MVSSRLSDITTRMRGMPALQPDSSHKGRGSSCGPLPLEPRIPLPTPRASTTTLGQVLLDFRDALVQFLDHGTKLLHHDHFASSAIRGRLRDDAP